MNAPPVPNEDKKDTKGVEVVAWKVTRNEILLTYYFTEQGATEYVERKKNEVVEGAEYVVSKEVIMSIEA